MDTKAGTTTGMASMLETRKAKGIKGWFFSLPSLAQSLMVVAMIEIPIFAFFIFGKIFGFITGFME